ncbi:MAG: 4-oxalomesaconate tautomerase [Rhodospirillaceae bacterium]|nr:4-oxalomesaconate tautomerase [Rhodospirillaceae bacterium]
MKQTAIPATLMRGGTSKGPFFLKSDLPADSETRDRVLLSVMGSPDVRQIDGIGGADPLTSKVAIVSKSERGDADIDFLFAQVSVADALVDTTPNCGNMLAGVGPFAIENGLVNASDPETKVRIHTINTGMIAEATIQTPGGVVTYDGDARIDGVPGTAAPIIINFLDVAGSVCGSLLPSGNALDVADGVEVTLIDNGMPVVVLAAGDVGVSGYETRDELNANEQLKERIERIRLDAGRLMGLGDVSEKVVPKMALVAPPKNGGTITVRSFIPRVCHASVGVLAAVTVGTACLLPGSPAARVAKIPAGTSKRMSIEHPTGEFTVELSVEINDGVPNVSRAALLRTARKLFKGEVFIPRSVWDGV